MKPLTLVALLVFSVFISGCAVIAVQDMNRVTDAYRAQNRTDPELIPLRGKIWLGNGNATPLSYYENRERPNQKEKQAIMKLYASYKTYQDTYKATVNKYSAEYNDIINKGFAAMETLMIELYKGNINYGEFATRAKEVRDWGNSAGAQRDREVQARMSRQFSNYLFNQQLIDSMNRPTSIVPFTCHSAGIAWHCF